jgi:hypothetical protein
MMRRLSETLRFFVTLLLLLLQQCSALSSSRRTTYRHLVVLVHGYLGSDREQEYLGEALIKESKKSCHGSDHQLIILNSKANVQTSTDGVVMGGKRLAAEISEWIEQQTAEIERAESDPESSTIVTFSLIGNSLGGLYGRYALAELDFFHNNNDNKNPILPLVFCTTSSPHLGVSQETFIELPRWIEPHVATVFQQQTMNDLFGVKNSTVVKDMCLNPTPETNDDDNNDYLYPLQQFQKRIAVANAYKTDFLVSVSSGAFLSLDSDSIHHHQDTLTSSTRLMKDMGHVALQVITKPTTTKTTESRDDKDADESDATTLRKCVDSLDKLGWHKIFIDARKILPGFMNLQTPELEPRASYTSMELKEHFETFGTLFPIAHPLNMANAKTDWYRKITQSGQPIMDALAELLVSDMVELSEKQHRS